MNLQILWRLYRSASRMLGSTTQSTWWSHSPCLSLCSNTLNFIHATMHPRCASSHASRQAWRSHVGWARALILLVKSDPTSCTSWNITISLLVNCIQEKAITPSLTTNQSCMMSAFILPLRIWAVSHPRSCATMWMMSYSLHLGYKAWLLNQLPNAGSNLDLAISAKRWNVEYTLMDMSIQIWSRKGKERISQGPR